MLASSRTVVILTAAFMTMTAPVMAQSTTITFRFNDTEAEVRGAIDEFQRQNPDIKIDLQRIGWRDAQNQFLREAATGGGPDVIHSAQVWVKEMGQAGAARVLDDFIKADPPPNGFDDFLSQDLAKGPGERIYGLPWTTDTWAMVFRTDLLKEAGLDKPPVTWEELRKPSADVFK